MDDQYAHFLGTFRTWDFLFFEADNMYAAICFGFLLSQALLKKHEALMSDLSAYGSSIQALREQAQACRVSKNWHLPFPVSLCS